MEDNFNYGLWYAEKTLKEYKEKLVELEKKKRFIELDIEICKDGIKRFEKSVEKAKRG
jgi:hypothetical protein